MLVKQCGLFGTAAGDSGGLSMKRFALFGIAAVVLAGTIQMGMAQPAQAKSIRSIAQSAVNSLVGNRYNSYAYNSNPYYRGYGYNPASYGNYGGNPYGYGYGYNQGVGGSIKNLATRYILSNVLGGLF